MGFQIAIFGVVVKKWKVLPLEHKTWINLLTQNQIDALFLRVLGICRLPGKLRLGISPTLSLRIPQIFNQRWLVVGHVDDWDPFRDTVLKRFLDGFRFAQDSCCPDSDLPHLSQTLLISSLFRLFLATV